MKTKALFRIGFFITLLLFVVSCQTERNTGNFIFNTVKENTEAHLFNDTNNPSCNLSIEYTYIKNSSQEVLKDTLNNYLTTLFFGDSYVNRPIEEIITDYTNDYVQTYKSDLESLFKEDKEINKENGESIGPWYNYEKTLNSNIESYNKDLLVYKIYYQEYTGGAHGIYSTNYYNFDLKTKMILKLEDIFVPNYKKALVEEIWRQLIKDNKVSTKEELRDMGYEYSDELSPTSNFKLDKQSITFLYNVYEIAPYSMGSISITIPYAQITHLFNSNPIWQSIYEIK